MAVNDGEIGAFKILSGLPHKYIGVMSSLSQLTHFAAGEQLFRQGEVADHFYLIRHGLVSIEIPSASDRTIIQTVGEGDVVGWSWLFPPYRWRFDARAERETLAISVDADTMRKSCEEDHDPGYEMFKRFSQVMLERLQATRLQLRGSL